MTLRPAPLAVFRRRRTWAELGYALLGPLQGAAFFAVALVTFVAGVGLAITFVGLPLLAVTNVFCRWLTREARRGADTLLGERLADPPPLRRRPGLLGFIGSALGDQWGWRARLYMVLKLPLGLLMFVPTVVFYVYGAGALTYAIWRPFLPCNTHTPDGRCHRGTQTWNNYTIDRPVGIVVFALIGALLLLAAPWVTKSVVALDRAVTKLLIVPSRDAERVAELEESRAIAVDDAATTLRRIERDLHDGAQARLVALAMNVGLAKEKLAEGGDPAEAQRLLDAAHAGAKDAIVELRDLARGIHPPVLDAGLDQALATLAANSAVPVELTTSITTRPAPAVETIGYFCAAELLTNIAKHSGARRARLDAHTSGDRLSIRVVDDGHGGARIGAGTGLTGLAERVRTVDGTLTVWSPAGGPTEVTVELPVGGRK